MKGRFNRRAVHGQRIGNYNLKHKQGKLRPQFRKPKVTARRPAGMRRRRPASF